MFGQQIVPNHQLLMSPFEWEKKDNDKITEYKGNAKVSWE